MHRLRDGRPSGCDHLPHEIFADPFFANIESVTRCIYCDQTFKLGDMVWDPAWNFWCCPYPGCSGTLIDFIPAPGNRRPKRSAIRQGLH